MNNKDLHDHICPCLHPDDFRGSKPQTYLCPGSPAQLQRSLGNPMLRRRKMAYFLGVTARRAVPYRRRRTLRGTKRKRSWGPQPTLATTYD